MEFIKKNWLPILFTLFVVELAFFVWWSMQHDFTPDTQVSQPSPQEVDKIGSHIDDVNTKVKKQLEAVPPTLAEELSQSRLYFMLTSKTTTSVLQSFVFENGKFSDPEAQEDFWDRYYSYSSDGNKVVFFGIPLEHSHQPGEWGDQAALYLANTSGDLHGAFPERDSATVLDQTNIPFKQHPDVSNAGDVLFIGWLHKTQPAVEKSDDWTIYIIEGGKAKFLTNGFMPKWINDNEFMFLKNDGLYVASKDLSIYKKIGTASEADVVMSNNRFDISDDGKLLAWTQPNRPQVFIYGIGENYELSLKQVFLSKAFWTLFSPSSNYLAVETIDLYAGGMEESPKAKIEFYDMQTFLKVPEIEIDFDDFDQMNMYFTDWVKK